MPHRFWKRNKDLDNAAGQSKQASTNLEHHDKSLSASSRQPQYVSRSKRSTSGVHLHKANVPAQDKNPENLLPRVQLEPEDLWHQARLVLNEDTEGQKLLRRYEEILQTELESDDGSFAVPGTVTDRQPRTAALLVAKKLKAIEATHWKFQWRERTVEIKPQVDRLIRAALFAKDFVSSAASTEPHAALAWAGVSILLPVLLNPASQHESLVEGVDYISTFIDRFRVVERIYRPQKVKLGDVSEDLSKLFETQLVKLYSQILNYQAHVICHLDRFPLQRYALDVVKADDWAKLLTAIRDQESVCQQHFRLIDSARFDVALKKQENRIEELIRSQERDREERILKHRTTEETDCLKALCTSTYEEYKNRNPDRVQGTCQWFLNNEKYHSWLEKKSSSLLWVTADPGCGKSVLSKSLVDGELRGTETTSTVYFFFKADSSEQQSVVNALCALLHQMCEQNSALLRKAVQAYQRKGSKLTASFLWLWNLFLEIVQCSEAGEIICVLDALDECESQGRELLIDSLNKYFLSKESIGGNFKILLTSRPYYDIEERFDRSIIRMAGEDESEIIRREIDLVIRTQVPKIAAKKKLSKEVQSTLEERLLKIEHRTYLWLHLTLASIEKELDVSSSKRMADFLDQLPESVYEAYESILKRAANHKQARDLLQIMVAATRPLTLSEMNTALNVDQDKISQANIDLHPQEFFEFYVKNLCGLFVSVYRNRVYLIHQTAREFLTSEAIQSDKAGGTKHIFWQHSIRPSESHLLLAKKCMTYLLSAVPEQQSYLSHDLRNITLANIKNVKSKRVIGILCGQEAALQSAFMDYAAGNWPYHFESSNIDATAIRLWHQVCDTSSNHFIVWFNIFWNRHRNKTLRLQPRDRAQPEPLSSLSRLMVAIILRHGSMVKSLLETKIDLTVRDDMGWTALFWAIRNNSEMFVEILLDLGASVHIRDNSGDMPIHWALEADLGILKLLLAAGADPKSQGRLGMTLLHQAAEITLNQKSPQVLVNLLLEAGGDLNVQNDSGRTPLHVNVIRGYNMALAKAFLEAGADPNVGDRGSWYPLHSVIFYHRNNVTPTENTFTALVKTGADPQNKAAVDDPELRSWFSSSNWRVETRKATFAALLDAGANPNARNISGETPLHVLAGQFIGRVNIREGTLTEALKAEADICTKKYDLGKGYYTSIGEYSLYSRISRLDSDTDFCRAALAALVKAGADPNARDVEGLTPLHTIALAANGSEGSTPLYPVTSPSYAERHNQNHKAFIRALISAGANPYLKTNSGDTPLDLARKAHDEVAVEVLESVPPSSFTYDEESRNTHVDVSETESVYQAMRAKISSTHVRFWYISLALILLSIIGSRMTVSQNMA